MTKERKTHKNDSEETLIDPTQTESTQTQADKNAPQEPAEPSAELVALLEKAEAQRDEYLNLAQRVQADFDNFRRRNQSVRAEATADGANEVLTQLLPVVDNLERAIDAAQNDASASLRDGVTLVLRQLREVMGKFGVEDINRVGQAFDPMLENAVLQGTAEEGEPGTVCEVFQKGYKTQTKVLRHAMVKVVVG